jgi:hypothetical protein
LSLFSLFFLLFSRLSHAHIHTYTNTSIHR